MKKILLSLLLAGTVQNSFAMGSCGGGAAQGGGQAAEFGSIVEGQVPVVFSDGLVVYLDLHRLRALNSGLLEGILFTADGLSGIGEVSEDNPLVMEKVFANLEDFEKFEKIFKGQLSGEIADMVDFFKKADFLGIDTVKHLKGLLAKDKEQFFKKADLGIDTVEHLKGLFAKDEEQFFKLCRALLETNLGFVSNMQRVYPEILHHAIRTKDPDFAKMLIDSGANVKVIDWQGITALMVAAQYVYTTEIAQLLIAAHADVNARDSYGITALMYAARCGRTEIAQLLIDAKADVNAKDYQGKTALMRAAEHGHTEIAQFLRDAGAS